MTSYKRLTLNYETPSVWTYHFGALGRLDLTPEIGASYWQADGFAFAGPRLATERDPHVPLVGRASAYLEAGIGHRALQHALCRREHQHGLPVRRPRRLGLHRTTGSAFVTRTLQRQHQAAQPRPDVVQRTTRIVLTAPLLPLLGRM